MIWFQPTYTWEAAGVPLRTSLAPDNLSQRHSAGKTFHGIVIMYVWKIWITRCISERRVFFFGHTKKHLTYLFDGCPTKMCEPRRGSPANFILVRIPWDRPGLTIDWRLGIQVYTYLGISSAQSASWEEKYYNIFVPKYHIDVGYRLVVTSFLGVANSQAKGAERIDHKSIEMTWNADRISSLSSVHSINNDRRWPANVGVLCSACRIVSAIMIDRATLQPMHKMRCHWQSTKRP